MPKKTSAQLDREIAEVLNGNGNGSCGGSSKSTTTRKSNYDWESFTDGAAFAFWASPYMSEVNNLEEDAREADHAGNSRKAAAFKKAYEALSPGSGGSWDRVVGDPSPSTRALAKRFAKAVRDTLTEAQLDEVFSKFSAEKAGYYGAMQSQGEGVGWYNEGVHVKPPSGFQWDRKVQNDIARAIARDAREAGAKLPRR